LLAEVRPAPLDFAEVYSRYADSVYRFCLSQLRDPAVAEDVAADVFASAFAAYRAAPIDPGVLRPWLFRIARNAAIDNRRRTHSRFRMLDALRADRRFSQDVEGAVVIREELRTVLAAIAKLRRRQRELVGLRVAAGLTYAQIGEVLGMSENAARMGVQRAIAKVRAAVGEDR